jgi:electron transfer flavoprotein beta subunit
MPDIMKAKRKPLDTIALDSMAIETPPLLENMGVEPPASRQAGVRVSTVDELVTALKNKGVL